MSIIDYDLTFTDEEIDEIIRKIELDAIGAGSHYGNGGRGWGYDDWDYEDDVKEDTRKCGHVWVPVLLISSTVYHCKHCGMKKEDYDKDNKTSG